MNHCVLEVEVKNAPTVRYTQDNKTAIAEMDVSFKGLRPDDPPATIKVVGWGNMAQDLQNQIHTGQKIIVEGRIRMNTIPRQDGTKEKKAELTLSRFHLIDGEKALQANSLNSNNPSNAIGKDIPTEKNSNAAKSQSQESPEWNSSPLIPDTDDIPF